MKRLRHLLYRELLHVKGLLIMLGISLLLMISMQLYVGAKNAPGAAEMLYLMKPFAVGGLFLTVAAVLGWSDSPLREHHHLLTRPLSWCEIYGAKAILICLLAVGIAIIESGFNLMSDLPTKFVRLSAILSCAGVAVLFIFGCARGQFWPLVRLLLVLIGGSIALGAGIVTSGLLLDRQTYIPSIVVICGAAMMFVGAWFVLNRWNPRWWVRGGLLVLMLAGLFFIPPLISPSYPVASVEKLKVVTEGKSPLQVVPNFFNPEIGSDSLYLALNSTKLDTTAFSGHDLAYTGQEFEITLGNGEEYLFPVFRELGPGNRRGPWMQVHQSEAQALLQMGEISEEQLGTLQNSQGSRWLNSHRHWLGRMRIPEKLIGKKVSARVKGLVHHHELRKLGQLKLETGARLHSSEEGMQVEIVDTHEVLKGRGLGIRFRCTMSQSGYSIRKPWVLITSASRPDIVVKPLRIMDELILSGMNTVSFPRINLSGFGLEHAYKETDDWEFRIYYWKDHGTAEFQSQSVSLTLNRLNQQTGPADYQQALPVLSTLDRQSRDRSLGEEVLTREQAWKHLEELPAFQQTPHHEASQLILRRIALEQPELLLEWIGKQGRGTGWFVDRYVRALAAVAPESFRDPVIAKLEQAPPLLQMIVSRNWLEGLQPRIHAMADTADENYHKSLAWALRSYGDKESLERLLNLFQLQPWLEDYLLLKRTPGFEQRISQALDMREVKLLRGGIDLHQPQREKVAIRCLIRDGRTKTLHYLLNQRSRFDDVRRDYLDNVILDRNFRPLPWHSFDINSASSIMKRIKYDKFRNYFILS